MSDARPRCLQTEATQAAATCRNVSIGHAHAVRSNHEQGHLEGGAHSCRCRRYAAWLLHLIRAGRQSRQIHVGCRRACPGGRGHRAWQSTATRTSLPSRSRLSAHDMVQSDSVTDDLGSGATPIVRVRWSLHDHAVRPQTCLPDAADVTMSTAGARRPGTARLIRSRLPQLSITQLGRSHNTPKPRPRHRCRGDRCRHGRTGADLLTPAQRHPQHPLSRSQS